MNGRPSTASVVNKLLTHPIGWDATWPPREPHAARSLTSDPMIKHRGHTFDGSCALCQTSYRESIEAIVDRVLNIVYGSDVTE